MNIERTTPLTSARWAKRHTLVALSFVAVFICYLDRVSISIAALPMQQTFHWSEAEKGLVLSSFFIGYFLFQVPGGVAANRFGGRRVLALAVVWWSVFTLLTPLAATISIPVLLAARIGMGLGEGTMFPAVYNMFAFWVPQTERSRSVGFLLSGVSLSTLFALSVSGWIIARFSWPSVFYLFGSLGLIWSVIWLVYMPEAASARTASEHAPELIPWVRLLRLPAIWALVVNHFCSNWTLYLLLTWLPSYFVNVQHLTLMKAGLYSAAPWLTLFVMINVVAWLADGLIRRGANVTFVRKLMQSIGLIGSGCFLLMMMRDASDAPTALVLLCSACGAHACTWSGFVVNHLDIAPRHADVLMGITNTAGSIPGAVGVALTGWLVQRSGSYASAFALAAGLNLVGAVVWLVFATGKRVLD